MYGIWSQCLGAAGSVRQTWYSPGNVCLCVEQYSEVEIFRNLSLALLVCTPNLPNINARNMYLDIRVFQENTTAK